MKERLLKRPQTAGPSRIFPDKLPNPPPLRPKSVQSRNESRCVSPTASRPKSGKSLTFQLGEGRQTPALSFSTQGFGSAFSPAPKIVSSTPKNASRSKDGLSNASGPSTLACSARENGHVTAEEYNALRDMEPAFLDVQLHVPGLTIWRTLNKKLSLLEDDEKGFFHEGNCYIVLQINSRTERSLHYWKGELSSENDREFIEEKAHDLDKIISSAHTFSSETQGHESIVFLSLFPDGIVYLEGKHKTAVPKAAQYDKKMYIVSGRKHPRAECVLPSSDHLQSKQTLILDGFPRMYVWIGKLAGYVQRNKVLRLARRMQRMQRKGKCHIVVIDENDIHLNDAFKRKLNEQTVHMPDKSCDAESTEENAKDKEKEVNLVLHRVSGDQVMYDMPEASRCPLKHRYLVTNDSYLLNRGADLPMYMWVGCRAKEEEVQRSIKRAKSFADHNGHAPFQSVCRIREDHEPTEFKKCFCDWKDRLSKNMSLTKRYSVGNIGRALFSSTDRRTIATVKECWSEDTVGDLEGDVQVWVLKDANLETVDEVGVFTNNRCYLVLLRTGDTSHEQLVLYYWLGSKTSVDDKTRIVQLAIEKSISYGNQSVLIRVLDGKEPAHFIAAMSNWMLVYDGDEITKEKQNHRMFGVRELFDNGIRIQQVPPTWSSLNSSSSFVILTQDTCYLWYGKLSGSTEREATKDLLRILCSERMFDYEIVTDGKESSSFANVLGVRQIVESGFKKKVTERRPPCLSNWDPACATFMDINDFSQEDLSEDDVNALDLFDQVFIWCGKSVSIETRKQVYDIAKTYIKLDPAGRCLDEVALWFLSQGHETMSFIKHFPSWTPSGYSGLHSYELQRKLLRQENAHIDVTGSMVDTGFLGRHKYPYKVLVKRDIPSDVDVKNKHLHLSERQFRENLKVSRSDFYHLPMWKQRQILKSARLLYSPPLPTHTLDIQEE